MRHNQKGFTLISVLAGFLVLMVLISLLTFGLKFWLQSKPEVNEFASYEYQVFLSQLELEFRQSEQFSISHNQRAVSFNNNKDIVRYEPYQTSIRRVVNGTGHEITLQHAGQYRFEYHPAGILIIRTEKNKEHTNLLIHPRKWSKDI
ncbi:competence type IV pilus minor pilin ComGF [Alkalicoccus daliensis]|uniref:Competence protein ComGF n=1 Tax=Alkalicoccus daliensis TaxID=745820 RepID=A0A1H0B6W5_9BACI|nr:competence type IV pilus minor pilin ComGF [Alkalicoccus daliensis]SDN41292.1 competence protein ComGF [Alkalicoccus daliensis]